MFANIETAPKWVFVFKTANKIQTQYFRRVREAGHVVVSDDEKALSVAAPYVLRIVVDPEAMAVANLFMFQNEEHRNALGGSGPTVGSARVELLRSGLYKREKSAGRYILLNTNFTLSNRMWGSTENALRAAAQGGAIEMASVEGRAYAQSWIDSEKVNYEATLDLIPLLPKTHKIVVRPHPVKTRRHGNAIAGSQS